MSAGDLWQLSTGQRGMEMSSDGEWMRVAILDPEWPFMLWPPIPVRADRCVAVPSRYHSADGRVGGAP